MSIECCNVIRLGLTPYKQAWKFQESLAAQIAQGTHPPTLLLLEHPHIFTFGRRGRPENLLWDQAELERRGVQTLWVDRGGDVTYHGPGQLVGYPLLPLGRLGWQSQQIPESPKSSLPQADYVGYLRKLEDALILALRRLGVASIKVEGMTGVWVQQGGLSRNTVCGVDLRQRPAKIAAIGVKVDARGVSRHGFALNVNPDMSYWDGIIGCGLKDCPATSLAELLDPQPDLAQVADVMVTAFGQVFGYSMQETRREMIR